MSDYRNRPPVDQPSDPLAGLPKGAGISLLMWIMIGAVGYALAVVFGCA